MSSSAEKVDVRVSNFTLSLLDHLCQEIKGLGKGQQTLLERICIWGTSTAVNRLNGDHILKFSPPRDTPVGAHGQEHERLLKDVLLGRIYDLALAKGSSDTLCLTPAQKNTLTKMEEASEATSIDAVLMCTLLLLSESKFFHGLGWSLDWIVPNQEEEEASDLLSIIQDSNTPSSDKLPNDAITASFGDVTSVRGSGT